MKPQRVLALVHKGLEPPDEKVDKTTAQQAEWRMEYDVVRTLKVLGDLDADQVGEVMGRSANWVRVTQHRALARLADLLTNGQHIAQEMWADPVMQRTTETI